MGKPDWQNQSFKKSSGATGTTKAACKPLKMADGGEVSLWERLKAGNIDQEGSEAYNRWGAGSKSESVEQAPDYGSRSAEDVKASDFSTGGDDEAPAKRTSAAEFQRTDKDTTPVATPRAKPKRKPTVTVTKDVPAKATRKQYNTTVVDTNANVGAPAAKVGLTVNRGNASSGTTIQNAMADQKWLGKK